MARQALPLSPTVAVVTGGCGGIGMATGRALAARGVRVSLGDLDGEAAAASASELGDGHFGGEVDVTDSTSFAAFLDRTEETLGPIDFLVNNAGVMLLGPLDEESERATEKTIGVNLIGVINGTRLAMQRMKPRGRGRILNVASQAGKVGFPGGATYCATKFGVVGLCESVRNELSGTGVEVTCVLPGPVRTDLASGIGQAKGVRWLMPFEVGEGIADAIEYGQSEVWLPPVTRYLQSPTAVLPPGMRDRLLRLFGADAVLATAVVESERSEYEARALE